MGLLDGILGTSIDDPRTGATAAMVQGLLGSNNALGGMSHGLLGYQDQMARGRRQQQIEQMQKMQLAEMQRAMQQQAAQDKFRASIPSPQMQAAQQALQGGGGPTQSNAAQMRPVDPMAQFMHGAMQSGEITPMQYMQSQQKDTAPIISKAGDVARDRTGKILWQNEDKTTQPAALQEYAFAKQQGYGGSFLDFQLAQKRAGASSVSVGYGAPVAGIGPDGKPAFFQPSKDGSPPSVVQGFTPEGKAKPVEFTKSLAGLNELSNGLDSYSEALKSNGGVNPLAIGKQRAGLQSAFTALQMGMKNAFELGALAGPDIALLNGMIIDPTSPKAMMLGDKGIAEQNERAREYIRNRGRAVYKAHGMDAPAEYGQGAAPAPKPGGGLSAQEQAELAALRKQLGR